MEVLVEKLLMQGKNYNNKRVSTDGYLRYYGEVDGRYFFSIYSSREYYLSQNPNAEIKFSLDRPLASECIAGYVGVIGVFLYSRTRKKIVSTNEFQMIDVEVVFPINNVSPISDSLKGSVLLSDGEKEPTIAKNHCWKE